MKRVSFKVAKALKEAGYPQKPNYSESYCWYVTKHSEPIFDEPYEEEGTLVDDWDFATNMVSAPFAFEVRQWLWREKKIKVSSDFFRNDKWGARIDSPDEYHELFPFSDPEEAIIAAIEYLVNESLLK